MSAGIEKLLISSRIRSFLIRVNSESFRKKERRIPRHIAREKMKIIKDYNKYLIFLEKYFSNKNSKPLKTGKELVKQIFE